MNSAKPFFSIVLPTRNRATYLSSAIKTVLNQTFKDFELIISNNCSEDETEKIIKSFDDSRIRYIKPQTVLPLDSHWDFAFEHARGNYLTLLGDDDAYSYLYLELIREIIEKHRAEIVSCRMADYYYTAVNEKYGRQVSANSLVTGLFDNELSIYSSEQAIKNIYAHVGLIGGEAVVNFQSPQLINTAYHHKLFEKIKKRRSKIFPDVLANDYFLAVMSLNLTEKYYFLDSPLSLHGFSPVSASILIDKDSGKGVPKEDFTLVSRINKSPLKLLSPFNLVADALLMAKAELNSELDFIELNFTDYIKTAAKIIHHRELEGVNVVKDKKDLSDFIEQQDAKTKKLLENEILNWQTKLKDKIRLKIYGTKFYDFLRNRKPEPPNEKITIEGKNAGFDNIEQCGKAIDRDFLKKYSNSKLKT